MSFPRKRRPTTKSNCCYYRHNITIGVIVLRSYVIYVSRIYNFIFICNCRKKELSDPVKRKLKNKRDEETNALQSSFDKFTFRTTVFSTIAQNRNVCES